VVFVERAPGVVGVLRANLAALGLEERVRVVRDDACRAVRRLGAAGERFDLILLDPPYGPDEPPRALRAVAEAGVMAPDAMVVVEHSGRHPLPRVPGLRSLDSRRYGDTTITRLAAGTGEGEAGGSEGE
jgi:16S rRNA (guanine966-N2)-methyltransferase